MSRPAPLVKLTRTNTLVIFSDDHLGAVDHDAKHFDECIRWCLDNEATVYLSGDHVENSSLTGKDAGEKMLEQAMWPTAQVKAFIEAMRPLARKGRICGALRGNHESRSRREALLDVCELIAHALDVRYDGVGGMLRFQAGMEVYPVAIHHGRSGAGNTFLELDRMCRLYPTAELVSLGHNHDLTARRIQHVDVGPDGAERIRVRWQVRSGTMLRFADYARNLCLAPSLVGHPVIRFSPKSHDIAVDVTTLSWT